MYKTKENQLSAMKELRVKVCVTNALGVKTMLDMGYIVLLDSTTVDPPTEQVPKPKINRRVYIISPYPNPFTRMIRVWVCGKGGKEMPEDQAHNTRFYVEGMDTSVVREGLTNFLQAAVTIAKSLAPANCLDELGRAFFDLHSEISSLAAD